MRRISRPTPECEMQPARRKTGLIGCGGKFIAARGRTFAGWQPAFVNTGHITADDVSILPYQLTKTPKLFTDPAEQLLAFTSLSFDTITISSTVKRRLEHFLP